MQHINDIKMLKSSAVNTCGTQNESHRCVKNIQKNHLLFVLSVIVFGKMGYDFFLSFHT